MTGTFRGSAIFGPTTLNSLSGSDVEVFLAKFDTTGAVLWAKKAGGELNDSADSVAVLADGTAYVLGSFSAVGVFGSTTLDSAGPSDMFLAKYSSSGTLLWARRAGGAEGDYGGSVTVLADGTAYVLGSFSGSATYGATTLNSAGGTDIVLAKYSSTGDVVWAKRMGGTSSDNPGSVHVAADGAIYISGLFSGSATFGSISVVGDGQFYDLFVVKCDSSGVPLWVRHTDAGGDPHVQSAVDDEGSTYVVGSFNATPSVASLEGREIAAEKVLLASYNTDGDLRWFRIVEGSAGAAAVAAASNGNVYLAGSFSGTAIFGLQEITAVGSTDAFVAVYNSAGNVLTVDRAGNSGSTFGWGMAVGDDGAAYVGGRFNGTAKFGSTLLTATSQETDIFLAKWF